MAHPFPLFESIWTPNRDIAVTPEITEALRNSATVAIVEHAVLLGCARKYVALINRESGDLIASFSYFQNVIEEARELKMSAVYWQHLQMRVDGLERQWTQMKTGAAKRAPS